MIMLQRRAASPPAEMPPDSGRGGGGGGDGGGGRKQERERRRPQRVRDKERHRSPSPQPVTSPRATGEKGSFLSRLYQAKKRAERDGAGVLSDDEDADGRAGSRERGRAEKVDGVELLKGVEIPCMRLDIGEMMGSFFPGENIDVARERLEDEADKVPLLNPTPVEERAADLDEPMEGTTSPLSTSEGMGSDGGLASDGLGSDASPLSNSTPMSEGPEEMEPEEGQVSTADARDLHSSEQIVEPVEPVNEADDSYFFSPASPHDTSKSVPPPIVIHLPPPPSHPPPAILTSPKMAESRPLSPSLEDATSSDDEEALLTHILSPVVVARSPSPTLSIARSPSPTSRTSPTISRSPSPTIELRPPSPTPRSSSPTITPVVQVDVRPPSPIPPTTRSPTPKSPSISQFASTSPTASRSPSPTVPQFDLRPPSPTYPVARSPSPTLPPIEFDLRPPSPPPLARSPSPTLPSEPVASASSEDLLSCILAAAASVEAPLAASTPPMPLVMCLELPEIVVHLAATDETGPVVLRGAEAMDEDDGRAGRRGANLDACSSLFGGKRRSSSRGSSRSSGSRLPLSSASTLVDSDADADDVAVVVITAPSDAGSDEEEDSDDDDWQPSRPAHSQQNQLQDKRYLALPPPFTPRAHRYRRFRCDVEKEGRRESLRTDLLRLLGGEWGFEEGAETSDDGGNDVAT
ncbi:hypothetical protein HK101_002300 [Irineochytrium annulatum]|nr:hypothetical protein HK101_002300 [Irineochytrium annulatum]